jgi:hypothetical protein
VCDEPAHSKGTIPKAVCKLWHMRPPPSKGQGNSNGRRTPPPPSNRNRGSNSSSSNKTVNKPMPGLVMALKEEVEREELQARLCKARLVSLGLTFSAAVTHPIRHLRGTSI